MKNQLQFLANKVGYNITRRRTIDPFLAMKHLLCSVTRPIIFDVGAHHGHIARHFRSLFPDSEIFAFEPYSESYEKLKINLKNEERTHAFNMGLAEKSGERKFNINISKLTSSLLETDFQAATTWGKGYLETHRVDILEFETIDSIMARHKLDSIDILKLDVQGAEPLVMEGARNSCLAQKIRLIYTEIIIQPTYQGQARLDKFIEAFYEYGFDLYNIYNLSCMPSGRLRQVDAIFTVRGF